MSARKKTVTKREKKRTKVNGGASAPLEPAMHVLPASALEGVDLPQETLAALAREGVPRKLVLPKWLGPTLFTSELGSGRLLLTSEPGALVERTSSGAASSVDPLARGGSNEGYIIGSVRELMGEPIVYSVFVLRKNVGDVLLLDARDPALDRFVSSSLATFLTSMDAWRMAFPHLSASAERARTALDAFKKLLEKIDPKALEDEESYWPGWIDELEMQLENE